MQRFVTRRPPGLALLLVLLTSFLISSIAAAKGPFIRIGVLNNEGKNPNEIIRDWQSTVDYLAMRLPRYDFEIVPLGYYEVLSVAKNRQIDFLLANPVLLVNLEVQDQAKSIVQLNHEYEEELIEEYGSVIFTRADSALADITSLKGKSLAAVNEFSLGGYLATRRLLLESQVDVTSDLSGTDFTNSPRAVLENVLNGLNDVGTLRSSQIEAFMVAGRVKESQLKILHSQRSSFPFALSTRLYPEWALAKLSHADDELSQQLALSLLRMPAGYSPMLNSLPVRWTLPEDNSAVHELLQTLELPPFDFPASFTVKDVINRYWFWVMLILFMTLTSLIVASMVIRRNRNLELAKRRLERHNELILNSVADGIYGIDTNGKCTFVNQAMENITGWRQQELINRSLQPLLHHSRPDGSPATPEECPMFASFRDNKSRYKSHDVFWKKDNTPIPVEYSSTPIRTRRGEIIGGVVVFRDITERLDAEEETRNHQNQLAHVARLSLLGEMASGIAHELNQPLTAIAMNSRVCVRMLDMPKPDLDECGDILDGISGQAERAGEIIQQIRHLANKKQPQIQPVNFGLIVDNVSEFLAREFRRHDIRFREDAPERDKLIVKVQQIQIEQVLLNLLRNAIDALFEVSPHHREITLSAHRTDNNRLKITVRDKGPGIDPALGESIFNPFVTGKDQGMGLGLSISQGIIEAHGDHIRIENHNDGAAFIFHLPLHGS